MSQTIVIDAPDGVLEVAALWQPAPQQGSIEKLALLCHPHPLFQGTMNNKVVTTMQRFARDAGMHVIRFNFRGVGQSSGEHDSGVGEVVDALTVLQWAATQTSARQLWLGGFSFGGYVAARVAEQLTVSPHVWGLGEFELQRLALIAPSVVQQDVSNLNLPVEQSFCVYGDADEVIDPAAMQAFVDRMGIKVSVLAGAGHFFHGRLSELKQLLATHSES